jgi:hypothetical protein
MDGNHSSRFYSYFSLTDPNDALVHEFDSHSQFRWNRGQEFMMCGLLVHMTNLKDMYR